MQSMLRIRVRAYENKILDASVKQIVDTAVRYDAVVRGPIPHLIVLYILSIVVVIVGILGQLAVLFTGKYPRSLFQFTAGVVRWQARMTAYLYGLTDIYPPFSISK